MWLTSPLCASHCVSSMVMVDQSVQLNLLRHMEIGLYFIWKAGKIMFKVALDGQDFTYSVHCFVLKK